VWVRTLSFGQRTPRKILTILFVSTGIFLKANPEERHKTAEDLQKEVEAARDKLGPGWLQKLRPYMAAVPGSDAFWWREGTRSRALVEQAPTAHNFVTSSCADFHWPTLHRLLGVLRKPFLDVRRAIRENPHIVVEYFVKRQRDWFKRFHYQGLRTEWSHHRYDFQSRDTIHDHVHSRLQFGPDCAALCDDMTRRMVFFNFEFFPCRLLLLGCISKYSSQTQISISGCTMRQATNCATNSRSMCPLPTKPLC